MSKKIPSKKEMSIQENYIISEKPEYVYIPLVVGNDTDTTLLVKKGDYVLKGTAIAKTKGNFRLPILSSISGLVMNIEEKTYLNGQKIKCVTIKNDFSETVYGKKENKKNIHQYTKQEFIEKLKESGILGMGGSGFPTYVKYDTNTKIKTLIVNAVECEPYITSDYIVTKNNPEEILETIDAIMDICNMEEAYIAIKSYNKKLKNILENYIGTYPKIKIFSVKNLYPIGWERKLIQTIKKVEYKTLPIEKGIIVNNISTIYAIYKALKYNEPLTERMITVTGENIKNPINILAKIGTPVASLIEQAGGYKQKETILVAGGPMMGNSMLEDDLVVSGNLNSILCLPKQNIENPISCLRCGKCIEVCPAKICPVLIKDNINNPDHLNQLYVNRCIECGLCSYICPSNIHVREFVRAAKKQLEK